MIRRLSDKK